MSAATEPAVDTARTRTGGIAIGFRRCGGEACHQDLEQVIAFARQEGFVGIDLMGDGDQHAARVRDSGLTVGSVDLRRWQDLISADADQRAQAVEENAAYLAACAAAGVHNVFAVLLPKDPSLGVQRNHELAVEGFRALAPIFVEYDLRLVIEGYPGPGALACTPDGYAAFFRDCDQARYGVNYDPSHLLRMGIDPLRFLDQFIDRVHHVHGKDTMIDQEALYRYGYHLPAHDGSGHGFGGTYWRYTIPGHGQVDWTAVCTRLEAGGYRGQISIELEDERFNGSDAGVAEGLRAARDLLRTV